jgi:CDP-glucose 4,6-dehydratase
MAFWSGRRVFITGHTGFKGGWLATWLGLLGAEVHGYALPPETTPSLFEVTRIGDRVHSVLGDIRDYPALKRALDDAKPSIVFHLAAQPLVRRSYKAPVETYATNVMGTVHLLEAVRASERPCAVVNVTSDKCYENREWMWGYREHDPMGGHDPYSSSKGCAELVTAAYRRSYFGETSGVRVATARAGNVIGGGDWAEDRLIPDCVRHFGSEQAVPLRNPNAKRPWQHVLEPLRGYLLLAEKLSTAREESPGTFDRGWNFGPYDSEVLPVSEVVDVFAKHWGGRAQWKATGGADVHEAQALKLDSTMAIESLGWRPKLGLDQALKLTAEWYQHHRAGKDARKITEAQIAQYQELKQETR